MDSRVTVHQSLILIMAELTDIDSRLQEVKQVVWHALKSMESCPHPLESRQSLASFGDFDTYSCGVCHEVRSGR
jgi:hypothetical protein